MTSFASLPPLAFAARRGGRVGPDPGTGRAHPPTPRNAAKPDPHPGRLASNQKMRQRWNKEVNGWQECMKKYIADLQAKADVAVKTANAAVAESNAAIAAYNAYGQGPAGAGRSGTK